MSNYINIENDERALYILSWLDVVERLDTLILEARHIQQNIIYLLHAPTLYQPLRYEESWLWGDDSERIEGMLTNKEGNPKENQAKSISNISILPYPRPSGDKEIHESWDNLSKEHLTFDPGLFENSSKRIPKEIFSNITKILQHYVYSGVWNRDQRSLYHMLISIQDLKRNILKDKWELSLHAYSFLDKGRDLKPGCGNSTGGSCASASKLLMLRSVILAKAKQYLARLNDHMSAFRIHADFSAQDHPSMSTERRRDSHLYSVFLRDRCRDLAIEIRELMRSFGIEVPEKKLSNIYHRWQHDYTSHSYSLNDKMNLDKSNGVTFQHFINTSYWMPERPDLQSVIAHEISHAALKEFFSDLSINSLDLMPDCFSDLLRQINRRIQIYEIERYSDNLTQSVLKEIACDLIATTLMGTSYLLSLFLELIGAGLEDIFAVAENVDDFETNMLDHLNNLPADYLQSREWYYRLHLVCVWAREISRVNGRPSSDLDMRLIASCETVVENLNIFLDDIVVESGKTSHYWKKFKDELCNFAKHSSAIKRCATWSVGRHKDHYTKKFTGGYDKGNRKMPRSSRTLHPSLRNFLVQGFIAKKTDLRAQILSKFGGPPADSEPKKLIERYELTYKDVTDEEPNSLYVPELFTCIYDIPWQSAYLRAMDYVDPEHGLVPKKLAAFTWNAHLNLALGRESYQLALDHYINDTESTCNRLSEVFRIVKSYTDTDDKNHPELGGDLKCWLDGKTPVETITSLPTDEIPPVWVNRKVLELIKELPGVHNKYRARLRVIGKKIKDLHRILSHHDPSIPSVFRELHVFMMVRYRGGNSNDHYVKLLKSMSHKEKKKRPLPTYMLFKTCIAGRYAVPQKKPGGKPEDLSLGIIDRPFERNKEKKGITYDEPLKVAQGFVIGRYDAITIQRVRPMFRCLLPYFNYPEKKDEKECLPSFFVRRELLTPVNIGKNPWDEIEKKTTYALISVTLSRTAARLDFLSRLLYWVEKGESGAGEKKTLSHLAKLLNVDNGDRVFLSDGWGDLLFVIAIDDKPQADIKSERLENLFSMQSILFEDFQTEKTELILTSYCVDDALSEEGKKKFQVSMHARLLEDRRGEGRNEKYIGDISKELKEKNIDSDKFKLTRTPGRMDFSLKGNIDSIGEFNSLLEIMTMDIVDRFQTNIGLIVPLPPSLPQKKIRLRHYCPVKHQPTSK